MTTALEIKCVGCGAEITGGHAFVNDHGWFHNSECVRAHWRATNYVPGDQPRLSRPSVGKAIEWLTAATVDWDGSEMKGGEPPKGHITCRDFREVSSLLSRLSADSRTTRADALKMRAALEQAVEWADRHGKEPDWLDDARAALSSAKEPGHD